MAKHETGDARNRSHSVTLSEAASEAAQSKGPRRETSPATSRPVLSVPARNRGALPVRPEAAPRPPVPGTETSRGSDDGNGQYLLTRAASTAPAPAATGPSGQVLSDRQFLLFIEHYQSMAPDAVYDHLMQTTDDQRLMIQLSGALEQDLCFHACQGSKGTDLVWATTAGTIGCAQVVYDRQQHLQLFASMGMTGDPLAQRTIEQMQLVNTYKCKLGDHSPELCAAYYRTQSEISTTMHDTTMAIIDNMGNSGCTEHWEEDQSGNRTYLGCW